jgi:N-acetylglucosamine-6-phosphate deacetylase
LVRDAGVSLKDAVGMAASRPRQLLGLPENSLDVGDLADVVVFDWEPGGVIIVRQVV